MLHDNFFLTNDFYVVNMRGDHLPKRGGLYIKNQSVRYIWLGNFTTL